MHNVEMITGERFSSISKGNYDQNKNTIDVYFHWKEAQFLKVSESNHTHAKSHTESTYESWVTSKKRGKKFVNFTND